MSCNGFVPIAFLIISLTLIKYFSNLNLKKRKDKTMEHKINKQPKLKIGINSLIETIWAFGTSVAATCAL